LFANLLLFVDLTLDVVDSYFEFDLSLPKEVRGQFFLLQPLIPSPEKIVIF